MKVSDLIGLIAALVMGAFLLFFYLLKIEPENKAAKQPKAKGVTEVASMAAGESAKPATDDAQWKKAEKLVKLMLKQGTLRRIDPSAHQAWIDGATWVMLDAQNKEAVTRSLAVYCMPAYPEIDIYDAQSARKIASYGPFQGFKVY